MPEDEREREVMCSNQLYTLSYFSLYTHSSPVSCKPNVCPVRRSADETLGRNDSSPTLFAITY
jgi:hypothetical protein